MVLDGAPGLVAQFSKCAFWNLGNFWDRNMWSKKFSSKTFWSKNFSIEKRKIFFRYQKKSGGKSMKKSMKIKISKFREKKLKTSKFWIDCFSKFFWSRIFSRKSKFLHEKQYYFLPDVFPRKMWLSSFISARLEQPKTKLTDRKHKMSTFLCLLERSLGYPESTLRTNSILKFHPKLCIISTHSEVHACLPIGET